MRSAHHAALTAAGLALVFLGVGSLRPASAQVAQTAYRFQTIQPHPQIHALGNATVAARGYPGAIGINPAAIGTDGAVRIGSTLNLSRGPLYSSPWNVSPLINSIAAPSATVKVGRWAAGLQLKHFDWKDREFRNSQGETIGTTAHQQSIKGATAYEVNPKVTVGAGINLIRSRLPFRFGRDIEHHFTFDLGVQYQTQVEKDLATLRPALGLSLTDFGGNVSYENRSGDLAAPTMIRGGGGLQIVSRSKQFGRPEWRIGLYGALSNQLVNGAFRDSTGHFEADGPFKALFTGWGSTAGVSQSRGERAEVSPWGRITKHAGLEMSALDLLSIRLGRFHENEDNGSRQYTALGLGLNAYYVSLDASWTLGDEDPFQQFSYGRLTVRIPLSDSSRNFWPALLGNDR